MIATTIGYLFMLGGILVTIYSAVEAKGPYLYDWKAGIIPGLIGGAVPFALGLALVCR